LEGLRARQLKSEALDPRRCASPALRKFTSSVANAVELILADSGRLPFDDETFEVCLSIGGPSCIGGHTILEALQEQARITKPGGCLVMSDMFRDPSYPNPWIDEDHPSDRGWWEALESAGMRVISFEHFPVTALIDRQATWPFTEW
jgi:ubiquinone/menaquinone biosynthesis C-methylase UbiE